MWISGESSGKNVPATTGRPGGFTLIEILGVMAIIATLTAGPRIVSETSHVVELLMKTTYL
jgi:prepilin-type N-terminal cleavage/methylation domain-containing protein